MPILGIILFIIFLSALSEDSGLVNAILNGIIATFGIGLLLIITGIVLFMRHALSNCTTLC